MLLELFQQSFEQFIDIVVGRVVEQHPGKTDRDELRKRVKQVMFWMIETASFNIIKRVSLAAGHAALGETYREVRRNIGSNAADLIDISIKLDNLGFPDEDLQELNEKFAPRVGKAAKTERRVKDVFCDRLLRQLVVEHFYLFPTKDSTKQKVCAALDINIQKLRQIDETAVNVKQVPR